jgi:protease I
MPAVNEAKILILAASGFEQSELEVPRDRLRAAGATVHVATPEGDDIRGWDRDSWGEQAEADLSLAEARAEEYDAVVLPGGQINPDILRTKSEAIDLIRAFADAGKPVAAICHAPWLLIEAGLANGKRMTSYHSIRTDLRNAGAQVVDQSLVADAPILTSRSPADLDEFVKGVMDALMKGVDRVAA